MAVSTLIAAGTAQTSDRDVWASPLIMQANWKNPITVRTGFETRIEQALTLSEQRRLLRGTPRRSLSCSLTGIGRISTLAARQLLTRRSMAGFLMPLYSDQMVLSASATAGAASVSVQTTTLRRVASGSRVLILKDEVQNVTDFEELIVNSVGATSLGFTTNLTGSYPAGAWVIPLFESQMIDSYSNGFVLTDDKADFQNFTAQERVGPTQLAGIATVGSNPSGFDTFTDSTGTSLPVFDGPLDYSQINFGINRIGSFSDAGIGALPVFYGERGVQKFSGLLNCTTRQEAWDFLRLFESRGGRAYPFYLRSPWEDYRVTGTNGNNLLVEDTGDLLDWNYRPYLVMELADGSWDYREVSGVTQNSTNHEVAFVGSAALGSVVGARQLFKVRMFRDEIAERWLSTERCQMTMEVVEVLEEKTVNMTETLATHTGASIATDTGDVISLGIGAAINFDATVAVSPDIALGGCEASGVWHLKDCDTETLYRNTLTDLSAYVGGSVKLDGDDTCYEVFAGYLEGAAIQNVTVDEGFVDCDACDSPNAPCSCPSGLASGYAIAASDLPCSGEATTSFTLSGTCPTWSGSPPPSTSIDATLNLDTVSDPNCFWKIVLQCDIGGGDDSAIYQKTIGNSPIGVYTRTTDGAFASFPATVTIT